MTQSGALPAPPLRVGLVGANWGLSHLEAWRAVPGVEVAAICTAHRGTAEAVASQHGVPTAYWDAATMLREGGLDVVDVTIRPSARVPIIEAALEAGKHVLQPLPFALNLPQGHALVERALEVGAVAGIEVLHRHTPAFLQAKAMIDAGFLGEIYSIEGGVRSGILLDIAPGYVYEWITQPRDAASALRNFGAHLVHVLLWLFGDIDAVSAAMATSLRELRFRDGTTALNHTADTAHALLRFASGALGSLKVSWVTPAAPGFEIDAHGSEGRIVLRADGLGPQNAQLFAAGRLAGELAPVAVEPRYEEAARRLLRIPPGMRGRGYALAAMCEAMVRAIAGVDTVAPSFADAYRVMQVVEAAYAAAEQRTCVAV
jgi:predicted dehydrogenase